MVSSTDFFSVDTVFVKRLYVLFFTHLESRWILFAACTESPDSGWVTQQARARRIVAQSYVGWNNARSGGL